MKLLGDIEAGALRLHHLDNGSQMALRYPPSQDIVGPAVNAAKKALFHEEITKYL